MNPDTPDGMTSNGPWPNSDPRERVPSTSMLPDSERDAPAAGVLVMNAGRGAHDTVDRLADGAASAVRQMGEKVAAAESALHRTADQWRDTGDAWAQSVRTTVRKRPLACIAASLALGMLIVRMAR